MAKSKKKEASKEEVVVNVGNLGVPAAIIISGIIIAVVIFFASKNITTVKPETEDSGDQEIAQDYDDEEPTEGKATISGAFALGDPDTATVAIIEYSDYLCGFCQRHFSETFPSIKEEYIDTGKILYVFKKFPLSSPGDLSYDIAEGSVCLYDLLDEDAFLSFHEEAFSLSSKDQLIALAKKVGADEDDFTKCLNENKSREYVNSTLEEGREIGISGTPGFLVGPIGDNGEVEGELIFGAYPYDTFKSAIEASL